MNRTRRSRLACLAVVLLIPMVLMGCLEMCAILCSPYLLFPGVGVFGWAICFISCVPPEICLLNPDLPGCSATSEQLQLAAFEFCEEYPEECEATFVQMQLAAIELCNEYPEECQQAFDVWVESLEEAEE